MLDKLNKSHGQPTMKERMQEGSAFFRQWMRAPLATAALFPSSDALAQAVARSITPAMCPVVELGPGTGAVTRQLVRNGIAEEQLVLIECNRFFAGQLQDRFPAARIVQGMADEVGQMTFDTAPGVVVSGLPLMSMPNDVVEDTLKAAFRVLRPGGYVVQFTYAPRCPVNRAVRKRLHLVSRLQELVWRNLPPARVYQLYRRED